MRQLLVLSVLSASLAAAPAFAQRVVSEAELRQFSAQRQDQDNRPSYHRSPLTWRASPAPGVSTHRGAATGVTCDLVTPPPFFLDPTPIVYSINAGQGQFAYAPWRTFHWPGPQHVLVQHDSGLDEVFVMTLEGRYFIAVLTPEQDARMRSAMAQPGAFRFTHRENSTTFDSAGAGDQLSTLQACQAQLETQTMLAASAETAPTAPPEPTEALQTLVNQGRWVAAIRFAATDNWTGRGPVNTRFLMSRIMAAPSANTPEVRHQLYLDREWMFRARSMAPFMSEADQAQMEAFINGIVSEFAPFDPGGPGHLINARNAGDCASRGGTMRASGCFSH